MIKLENLTRQFVGGAISAILCANLWADEIKYTSIRAVSGPNFDRGYSVDSLFFDVETKSYSFGPMIFKFENDCGVNFDCIFSDELSICIEKSNIFVGKKWSCRNVKFYAEKEIKLELLGRSIDVYDILGVESTGKWMQRYLYSESLGVVSFSSVLIGRGDKKYNVNYFLSNGVGLLSRDKKRN